MALYHYSVQWLGLPLPVFGSTQTSKVIENNKEFTQVTNDIKAETLEKFSLEKDTLISFISFSKLD